MNLFISWSGEQSKHIALALREWLPRVIQAIDPYMSDEDNEAGTLWDHVMTAKLEASSFGILCLTPTNVQSPWIHFEAGAISKLTQSRVVPLRYQLRTSDVRQPLARFHHKPLNKEGILDTLNSINTVLGDQRRKDEDIVELFDTVWPKLEARFDAVPVGEVFPPRKELDLLEEILELVRYQSRDSRDSVDFYPNATPSASGPGYIPVPDDEVPPSNRVMNQLVKTAGPEGTVTVSGLVPNRVVTVQSPRLRKDDVDADMLDKRFLREIRGILRTYGVQLVLHDGDKVCEPEWLKRVS